MTAAMVRFGFWILDFGFGFGFLAGFNRVLVQDESPSTNRRESTDRLKQRRALRRAILKKLAGRHQYRRHRHNRRRMPYSPYHHRSSIQSTANSIVHITTRIYYRDDVSTTAPSPLGGGNHRNHLCRSHPCFSHSRVVVVVGHDVNDV